MAKESHGSSDLLQIVILTLFLCAVFFGGWGLYSKFQYAKQHAARDKEAESHRKLKALLKKQESIDTLRNHRRREQSKKHSAEIDTAVQEVLDGMGNSAAKPVLADSHLYPAKKEGSGDAAIYESEWSGKLAPMALKDHLAFLHRLEVDRPHIRFKRL
ncbi:MAG: hypothetical protein ACE5GW_11330, partial [Planctomycetota bacterium]